MTTPREIAWRRLSSSSSGTVLTPFPHSRPSISCDTCPIASIFGPWILLWYRNPTLHQIAVSEVYLLGGTRCVCGLPHLSILFNPPYIPVSPCFTPRPSSSYR